MVKEIFWATHSSVDARSRASTSSLRPPASSRSDFLSVTDHATPRDVARALRSDSGGALALLQMTEATS
jgi:hypothetical protein